jgi:hypothetical protein
MQDGFRCLRTWAVQGPSPVGSHDRGMGPGRRRKTTTMATLAMAQAVLEHARTYYETGGGHVVAECWDVDAILDELDRQEGVSHRPFELDDGAIGHFAGMVPQPTWRRARG